MGEQESTSDDYFAYEKWILKVFGLRSSPYILYRIYGMLFLVTLTIHQMLVLINISTLMDSFDYLIFNILIAVGTNTILIINYYSYWNRSNIDTLFEKVTELNTLSNCNNIIDGNGFMAKYKNLIRKQGYIGSIAVCVGIIVYISTSLFLSVNQEEWLLPFGNGINIENNNIKYIINIASNTILAYVGFSQLFMYTNLLTFIYGHCKLFQKYISSIMVCQSTYSKQNIQNHDSNDFQIVNDTNNFVDWEQFKIKLRKLIPYHVGIYETAAEIENNFNMVILIWFGGFGIAACLLLYHMTTVNILSFLGIQDFIGVLTIYLSLILPSFWGEKVNTESEKIASCCYEVEFVGTDLRIQKALLLILLRSQTPIRLTIGKLKILSLSTMLSILQTTYSYYTILNSLYSE